MLYNPKNPAITSRPMTMNIEVVRNSWIIFTPFESRLASSVELSLDVNPNILFIVDILYMYMNAIPIVTGITTNPTIKNSPRITPTININNPNTIWNINTGILNFFMLAKLAVLRRLECSATSTQYNGLLRMDGIRHFWNDMMTIQRGNKIWRWIETNMLIAEKIANIPVNIKVSCSCWLCFPFLSLVMSLEIANATGE